MKRRKLIIIIAAILLLMPLGVTFSRYVIKSIRNYIMEANNFFFNSDKLVDGGITYGINNWGGASNIDIQFELNNHKNNLLTSASDITYTLTATPSDPSSIRCNLDYNSGVIYKAEKTDSVSLTVVPLRVFNDNESVSVTVEAVSSSPYVKTLSATFVITVGRRGIDYAITDSVGSPYFIFSITNALDTYKVTSGFTATVNGQSHTYSVNDTLTTEEYLQLSSENKSKCASAIITLTFNPSQVVMDTTSDILKRATYQTTTYNGVAYISSITFNIDVLTSEEIRFYKRNVSNNYTYPITNNTSIVTFSAS